jgi:Na+/proline symporter
MSIRITMSGDLDPNETAFLFIDKHSGAFLYAFALTGLLAALMSSGDSFLNIVSISAVQDFVGWRKKAVVNAEKSQFYIRIVTVIFGVVALFVALVFPYIVDLMVVGIGTIVIFVPVTLLALSTENPGKYARAAMWSILTGFFVNTAFFVWGVISPQAFEPKSSFIPAFIISALVLLLGMKITSKTKKLSNVDHI